MAKNNAAKSTPAFAMNSAYLNAQLVPQMQAAFNDHASIPNIKLGQILDAKSYSQLQAIVAKAKTTHHVDPLEYSYHIAQLKLEQLTNALAPFLKQTFNIVNKSKASDEWKLVCLTWKEYSMILDIQELRNGYDIIVDVTDDFPDNAGGDIVYTTGGNNTIEIAGSSNTLVLVKITKQTRSFLRYANHYAKNKKRIFLVQHV